MLNTYTDIKRQEVSLVLSTFFLAFGVIWHIFSKDMQITQWVAGLGTGAILAAISFLMKGGIGMGDCLVIAVVGSLKGAETAFWIFCLAIFLAGFYAIFLYLTNASGDKARFPFVPFLMITYMMMFPII